MITKITPHQTLPTSWAEREILRNKGQFWTPGWVADAMISYVSQDTDLIFDPATGRGAFYEALLRLNKSGISFFGTDVDEEVLSDPIYHNNNCIVEKKDFIKNPPERKFKSIVGNPPYIRHHRVDDQTKSQLKQLALNITGHSIDGRAGYHIYFLIQALNVLEQNGRLAFIMPADTCEGKFSTALWNWISQKFCIEAVITFNEEATPFPNVDTNAIVFLIKKSPPATTLYWVKANKANSFDLLDLVSSGFEQKKHTTIDVTKRQLKEAIQTGLSRPEQSANQHKFYLNDFASVMRGIATGCNEFFFLHASQIKDLAIPKEFLKRAIGRTKDIDTDIVTAADIDKLQKTNRPTYLLSIDKDDILPGSISAYLKLGETQGLPTHSLIRQRNPWYKMEKRKIPPLLFAYLGRRETRFILNEAGVLPLTGFLCVYPFREDNMFVKSLWHALNHPDTIKNLQLVGKSYGSGAIKVEPRNLGSLPIPEHIVDLYKLTEG